MQTQSYIAGCDLHKDMVYLTLINQQGYVETRGKFSLWDEELVHTLTHYQEKAPVTTVAEATYGWYGFAKVLQPTGIPLVLAHASQVNRVAGAKKTDKGDATILAQLYRTHMLTQAYLPPEEIRDLKETLRFRQQLVGKRGDLIRKLLDAAQKQHLQFPFSETLSKQAITWWLTQPWEAAYAQEITSILAVVQTLNQQLELLDATITDKGDAIPDVTHLKTIPGVGKIIALTLWVEIGEVTRFKDDRALSSYAGVVPSVHASADTLILGKTGNRGNGYLRWALAEAVPHLVRLDPGMKQLYEALKLKKGANKAKVAIMNKLLRIVYGMLKHHTDYIYQDKYAASQGPASSKAI